MAAIALSLAALGTAAAGCGSSSTPPPAQLALEREDLAFVCQTLARLEGQAGAEVRATRAAWPQVLGGLAPRRRGLYTPAIEDAVEAAQRLSLPQLFQERPAAALTGPASNIAGLYRTFAELAGRGWQMIAASIYEIEHGSPSAARFARANVPLYIESVYDGHFALAQISKALVKGYKKLGGATTLRGVLPEAEVIGLERTYDKERDQLEPQETVRLGS
jgi:hypothetical protein